MLTDHIEIVGARENNLKDVTVRIPKGRITVFTGVSGSGKSSLVFDTVAAEAQRQLNETFTAFARNFLPSYGHPDVDSIANLSAAIVVDQKRLGGSSRSTVGTITDINPLVRLLFSRVGAPHVGYSNAFSFNDPQGMCPECEGLGRVTTLDLDKLLDRSKSLNEGAILHSDFAVGGWYLSTYLMSGWFDGDKALSDYTDQEWEVFLHGTGKVPVEWQGGKINTTYEGLVDKFTRLYIKKDIGAMSDRNRESLLRFVTAGTCPLCKGGRLSPAALSVEVGGYHITDLLAMEATELLATLLELATTVEGAGRPIVESLTDRIRNLVTIGLGYIRLDRETTSLSGGESQRIKMVRHLSSSLTDMMYVFDEPSIGLHAHDVQRLNELLVKLRDKGNTVLVVEHDRDVIAVADHVIDMGPKAGAHGGEVVFAGSFDDLASAPTLTGRFIRHALPLKTQARTPTGALTIRGATLNNLRNVTVDIPTGVLTVVTGVAGSGKSTLVNEVFLGQFPDAINIDQSAVGASIRSNPATYTGLMDDIRRLFAKANGVNAGLFSFNSKGACANCQGLGVIYTDLGFMDGFKSPCEICRGRRFSEEVLEYHLRGKSIADVLELTAAEAAEFFTERKLRTILSAVNDVGLDYLRLGQPLSTLSGGECQRIKLATELHKTGTVYVMDEPTTGLHMSDIQHLLEIVDRLVNQGNSVVVIEHNLDVIKNADWIVDLGPEGGTKGGEVLFTGPPAELVKADTHTASAVRRDLEAFSRS
ncbi:excinuclease ABC subunit A [Asanoa ishikariensis]|uniref:UvrABC system protein A n=1 Tax=Asanoa ishikariensis TaxID=137265 RepID=A0A1H3UVL2_9ACTN|nr:excinuclease ABC subunit UvrA [Asanoa ishikariensis]GIF65006.1 excinuclease ABC subunit A [Asanoa ishikariensis]SDZ65859.1 excinuclease ABC, A subunit [Asanoa ishikariensis]